MSDWLDHQLLGHLLGALDEDEQAWLDARLEGDESCRGELTRWRQRLAPLEALRPDFEPPPGLAGRTCRMVAAFGPPPPRPAMPRVGMSPDPTAPVPASSVGWHDVIALGVLLLTAVALLFPAIDLSRFHSGLASCQDRLRQFGLALTQYGHHHGAEMSQLAEGGKLTDAGLVAATLMDDATDPDSDQNMCSEPWLAAQGATCRWSSPPMEIDILSETPGALAPGCFFAAASEPLDSEPWSFDSEDYANDGPGMWRDGTTDSLGNTLPTAMAVLTDDPSADLPGHYLCGHRGRGRNLFFRGGRVRFVPYSPPRDAVEPLFSGDEVYVSPGVSSPIIYVNR